MRLVPETHAEKIAFFQYRVASWLENADAIGLSAAEVEAIEAKAIAAREALVRQERAATAARMATMGLNVALDELSRLGSAAILKIRARASSDGGEVYQKAFIPAPAQPTRVGAPGTPYDFKATLEQGTGALQLRWRCRNPRRDGGTMYQVWRSVGMGQAMQFLEAVGKRKFIDYTVPQGVKQVTYRILAVRSTARGRAAEFSVNFGVDPGMHRMLMSTTIKGEVTHADAA